MARKYHQGKFKPLNPEKYVGDRTDIIYRSSFEFRFMRWCDANPNVLHWNSEGVVIPYFSAADGKQRRYFVDFVVKVQNGTKTETILIEIKPYCQTVAPVRGRKKEKTYLAECYDYQVNQDKWEAARHYATQQGWRFLVITEYDLGLKKWTQ